MPWASEKYYRNNKNNEFAKKHQNKIDEFEKNLENEISDFVKGGRICFKERFIATLIFKDKDFTDNIIYEKLLSDKLGVNLGYVYENVVAQILAANGHALYYYTFLNEKSKHN